MNPEAQRIAIAKLCGWSDFRRDLIDPNMLWGAKTLGTMKSEEMEVPHYLTDLNAMHEAEWALLSWGPEFRAVYYDLLRTRVDHRFAPATAPQRAEAFLRTFRRWVD